MWVPAIKVGDNKWLLSTAENRKIFLKFIESAILCEEKTHPDGTTSLVFVSDDREENSALVQPYTRWFGVHTDLKEQYDITRKHIELATKMAAAGIEGVIRGGKGGEGVSH